MAQQLLVLRFVKNPREMLAAAGGGIAGTIFDVVTLTVLVKVLPSIPLAAFLAAGVGAVVCFLWNKYIAFRDGTPVTIDQLVRYGAVAITTGILTAFAMKIFAVDLHVHIYVAKALSAALIFVAWTFPAQRRFVFKKPAIA